MFVNSNQLIDLLPYYNSKLKGIYSEKEIQNIFYTVCDYKHNLNRIDVKLSPNKLSESELLMHRQIVKRLVNDEPIQHIIGEVEFYGLPFKVNADVLIPRPETEELVDWIINETRVQNIRILDIGTGSGCIPISLKQGISIANVTAVDVSDKALSIAKQNAKINNVAVEFICADILKEDLKTLGQFDVIVSNPPYVLESDKAQMSHNVLKFDPHIALFVEDENPLLFYKRIVDLSKHLLKPKGKLYFEIHENFGQSVLELMESHNFKNIEVKTDLQGKDRMVKGEFLRS